VSAESIAFLDLPPRTRAAGQVRMPGSKSISNRALLLAALAAGSTTLDGVLESDDTAVMLEALARLGVRCERLAPARYRIEGAAGALPASSADLHLGLSGLSIRTLAAALAFGRGRYRLDGVPRMRERPLRDLVDALRALGAVVRYEAVEGYPPLLVEPYAPSPSVPDSTRIRGDVSSQFLTGLLQALPLRKRASVVDVEGELISQPYVAITLDLMKRFGVIVRQEEWKRFAVDAGARYVTPGSLAVEGDASSASYFLAAGAIAGGPVRVEGVGEASVQGDIAFAQVLARMGAQVNGSADWVEVRRVGALRGIELDATAIPDAAMTAAVAALFATGATTITGIGSWRVKETDRIAAMGTELRKLGAGVDEGPDWICVQPPARLQPATIDTYGDHRIAMCFALASLGDVAVRINDPACVRKTFPDFFAELDRLTS
jgi:3-phosphoshikimate 1-carboxyvinyltransferase